jgi:copper resistance protein C
MPRELTPAPGVGRWAAVLAVLLAVAGLGVSTPAAAWAGDAPVTATPTADAVLTAAPTEVALTFAADVQPELSHVAVLDAAGTDLATGDYDLPDPRRMALPVRIGATGDFTVAYHVTFPDGTSATGAYRFSVGTGRAPAPLDEAARLAATDSITEHAHSVDGLSAVILVVDAAVLFGVLALLWLRPRDRRPMTLRASEAADQPPAAVG